jgi:NAD(P)-dependent dehydrogenase (short-subunit alcohol dehydrogenase family)
MKNLHGRTAVIIGSALGIGRGTALALAKCGVNLVLADIDENGARQVAVAAQALGVEAMPIRCDVGSTESMQTLHDAATARFGAIDIVMNNVGVLVCGHPEDIPLAEWERILNTNLMSVVRGMQLFMPAMIARKSGHIVNTASFAGLFPYAYDRLPYAASKAAIVAISEGLALYLKPQGVGVTCLCPGPVRTSIGASMKSYTPGVGLRGPGKQFDMLEPDAVGDMVVRAIEEDTFLLPTHPQVLELLQARAAGFDAFLDRQIRGLDT